MLPPVNAVVNSSIAFQDPRAAQDGAADASIRPQGATPQAANGLEQNAAIAGRLNLLMLSGQERMSENLAMLVNLLGHRLGMERLEGEAVSGYTARLVHALGELTPHARQSVQRQLSQMFGGLQLRTLMEAFRNPAGPEAATLAIYLELYRTKDKDLAARTVVTSYRQNSGEIGPAAIPPAAPVVAGRMSSAAAPARSAGPLQRVEKPPTSMLEVPHSEAVLIDGDEPDDPMAPVARGRLFGMQDEQSRKALKLAAARALQATMSYGEASAGRRSAAEPATAETRKGSDEIGAPKEHSVHQDGKEPDAPATSARVSAELGEAPATTERAKAVIVIEAPAEPVPSETASPTEPEGPVGAVSPEKYGEEQPEGTTKTQTLFVLKGWTEEGVSEAEALLPPPLSTIEEIGPDPSSDPIPGPDRSPDRSPGPSLHPALGPNPGRGPDPIPGPGFDATPGSDPDPDPARLLRFSGAGDAEEERSPQTFWFTGSGEKIAVEQAGLATERHVDEALDQLESAAAAAEGIDDAMPERESLPHDLPDVEAALQRQPVIGRDGVPLPLVSYLFVDDEIVEQKGLKHRFSEEQGGEEGNGDAEGSADERDEDEREGEEQIDAALQRDSSEDEKADQIGAPEEGETPNDLYWRMAGWS